MGETMGELLKRARKEFAIPPRTKITFAGRLDPLASGVVVILAGDTRFRKDAYLGLPKRYTFDVVFGVSTDTGDVLGIVQDVKDAREIKKESVESALASLRGVSIQRYPAFSSRTVGGKPLFEYAKQGIDVVGPERNIEIHSISLASFTSMSFKEYADPALSKIALVKGDFRQAEIQKSWEAARGAYSITLKIAHCEAFVSSGTYIRSLAVKLGKNLGVPSLADSIRRTSVGDFTV
jgi:tRNA pseudouridine55 synthase